MKFYDRVYTVLKNVPAGRVTTYKALATALNSQAYQAIGGAMRRNPYAPEVPCHRVVNSNGSIGGFMGKTKGSQIRKKITLLTREGITVRNGKIVNFKRRLYRFT